MFERMLDKSSKPSENEMAMHCGEAGTLFLKFNEWLTDECGTARKVVFPYGNKYGWGVAHKKKRQFICNVFSESEAFTVMIRLSNAQFDSVYEEADEYMREIIDNKYPCGDGGWIHYRVTCEECLREIKKLITVKCK